MDFRCQQDYLHMKYCRQWEERKVGMLRRKLPSQILFRHSDFKNSDAGDNHHRALSKTLLSFLKRCLNVKQLQQIHAQMLTNFVHQPNFILAKIIDLKDFAYASIYFSTIHQPDEYAFNVMLRGLATSWRNYSLALVFYYQMKFSGQKPNKFTYPFVFIVCANLVELPHGQAAHSSVIKLGLDDDGHINHSLITMYSRCSELGSAKKVFDEITERDLVSWNSMISGYSKMGYHFEAMELFRRMKEGGFKPDEMTLVSVLGTCGELGDLTVGRWIEEFATENKMELNCHLGSALIHMYGKCGDLKLARRVFDSMKKRDNITWNAMITGYAQNGMSDEAINLFNVMREAGNDPDKITLVGTLSACASIAALDTGKQVDLYASQMGLKDDIYISTALVDMYAKCGSLDNALRVFENMPCKNNVTWNAMISGFAFHGGAQDAISLFKRMIKEGAVRPNEITFIGVLSACVHAGLLEEGRQFFHLMSSSFGVVPKVEHFSCMVDLLSRAGHLNEAWEFIQKMPEKPDGVILGALLGACQKRRNVDLSERVMKLLLEIEPSNSGNYVISSKLYANARRWDESAKVRMLMRQRGVNKTPGCSWIEIEGQLHEFHAGDDLYEKSTEINWVLDLLNEDLRREGYVPKPDLL